MTILDRLAEQRIRDAQARGDFDALPGAGRPLDLDEPPFVPEDIRMAYRILKNAGFLPPEIEARRELHAASRSVAEAHDDADRSVALRRLHAIELRLAATRPGARIEPAYRERVLDRLA